MDKFNTSVDNLLCTAVLRLSTEWLSYAQEQLVDKITTCGQCEQYCLNCQGVDLYSYKQTAKGDHYAKDIKRRVLEGA